MSYRDWRPLAKEWASFRDSPGIREPVKAEKEQALLRIAISVVGTCYFAASHFFGSEGNSYAVALWVGALFIFLSFTLLAWIRFSKKTVHPPRRLAGIVLDTSTVSLGLGLYGEAALPLYPVYLWVVFGNGFRFGVLYLFASALVSLIGLAVAVTLNDYFHHHSAIATALVVGLLLLPPYIALLLRKLNSTIRLADAANQAKSIFLANMSHELRTPLFSVIGAVECLADTKLTQDQRSLLDGMNASGQALLTLISDILDLARVDANKLIISEEDFDLHSLVNGTVQILGAEAERKQIRLRAHIDPAVPYRLRGDAHHVRQVLLNLLGNAVKFTDEGRVDVRVLATEHGEDRVVLRLEIEDTGVGIPYAAQPRVFEMFTQADESSSRRFGGSGLGTTIAKHIVEAMGGAIGFTSDPGRGSTFWFEVPVAAPDSEIEGTATLADRRILLVTSPGTDHDVVLNALSGWGATVDVAASGFRSIEMVRDAGSRALPYDAVIVNKDSMDFNLHQFAASVSAQRSRASMTLVLVDHDRQGPERRRELMQVGYDHVLSTPVNKSMLFNALRAAPAATLPDSVIDFTRYRAAQGEGPPRLLLIDDNELSRNVTVEILTRGGCAVDATGDPGEALDLLAERQYDLVVTDFQMPEMDGVQLIKFHLFSLPARPVPFLVLTADATVETRNAVNEAGAAGFLVKPVPSSVILKTVHDILERHRGVA